jgi:multidrug efflux system membrane fusion protein
MTGVRGVEDMMRFGSLAILTLIPLLSAAGAAPAETDAPVSVSVAAVETGDVPIYLDGIGAVQAYNTVAIKSRVDGQIAELRFHDGQEVAAGDVIAILDSRSFAATLKQMQANLHKDEAQLVNAKADLDRFEKLNEFATKQSVATQRSLVAQFEAQIASDEAQVDYAQTQLAYTTITSPIAGRTGIRQVDVGNIVHAGDPAPIVTIAQLHPISVVFTINADDLPSIDTGPAGRQLPVLAFAKDNRTELAQGTLDVVDNQIDQTTGTVKLRAVFANTDNRLWPGQFVNARLRVAIRHDGLTIPAIAVQQGPNGAYVWTVAPNNTAAMTPVVVAHVEDGKALIDQGVGPGQNVVIDGQYGLEPGREVTPVAAGAPPA